jgi:hypothetical protein
MLISLYSSVFSLGWPSSEPTFAARLLAAQLDPIDVKRALSYAIESGPKFAFSPVCPLVSLSPSLCLAVSSSLRSAPIDSTPLSPSPPSYSSSVSPAPPSSVVKESLSSPAVYRVLGFPMPLLGQPDAPLFNCEDVTGFLRQWNFRSEDYGLTDAQKCEHLSWYCAEDLKCVIE